MVSDNERVFYQNSRNIKDGDCYSDARRKGCSSALRDAGVSLSDVGNGRSG